MATKTQTKDMAVKGCVNCFSDKGKTLKCGACKMVRYCSKECQKSHWNEIHKSQCGDMKKYRKRVIKKDFGGSKKKMKELRDVSIKLAEDIIASLKSSGALHMLFDYIKTNEEQDRNGLVKVVKTLDGVYFDYEERRRLTNKNTNCAFYLYDGKTENYKEKDVDNHVYLAAFYIQIE